MLKLYTVGCVFLFFGVIAKVAEQQEQAAAEKAIYNKYKAKGCDPDNIDLMIALSYNLGGDGLKRDSDKALRVLYNILYSEDELVRTTARKIYAEISGTRILEIMLNSHPDRNK